MHLSQALHFIFSAPITLLLFLDFLMTLKSVKVVKILSLEYLLP